MLEILMKEDKLSVCSHGEDLDGLTSASLIMAVKPEGIELQFSAPYEIKNFGGSYDIVLDLPPPKGGARLLIDHHVSNCSLLDRVKAPILRPEAPSTARIVYDTISEWEPAMIRFSGLVGLTDRVDSGEMDVESALFTSAVRKIYKERKRKLIEVCRELIMNPPKESKELVELQSVKPIISSILRDNAVLIEELLSLAEGEALLLELKNYPSYLVPLIQLTSQKYKFFGTITRGSDGLLRLSLRSRKDSPLSALQLAEAFGGGGHEHAAGALIAPSDMPEVIKRIRETLSLEVMEL